VAAALLALLLWATSSPATVIGLGEAADYAVLGRTGVFVSIQNATTNITGNLGIGPSGVLDPASQGTLHGNLFVPNPAPYTPPAGLTISGTVNTSQNLSQAASDFASAVGEFAHLTPTQTFATLNVTTTITGNGGDNIIQVGSINLQSKNLTLSGGPNDYFIFNVTGDLLMSSTLMMLQGGVLAQHVLFNVLGDGTTNNGLSVNLLNTGSLLYGTFLAPNGNIDVGQATVNGSLLGGSGTTSQTPGITIHSGADINFVPFQPVPEPSSAVVVVLSGLTALGLAALRRLRRRSPPPLPEEVR
jgi:choice-of-anchor A domain-containing protein